MFKKLFGGFRAGRTEESPAESLSQRRKSARRPCDVEVEVSLGRKSSYVQMVDMSVGGLRLHSAASLGFKNKSVVRVTYPEPIPKVDALTVEGLVRWIRDHESDGSQSIGIEFKEPKSLGRSWVKAKMEDFGFRPFNLRDQRSNFRVSCRIPALLEFGDSMIKCSIKNVGLGGLFINLRQPMRAGATIAVKIGDHPQLANTVYKVTVRHEQQLDPADPFGYGCSFAGLEANQEKVLREFIVQQSQTQWENSTHRSSVDYYDDFSEPDEADDVEIPDLESILAGEADHDEV